MNLLRNYPSALVILVLSSTFVIAQDTPDTSTKVIATVKLPKTLPSFDGQTLELRLYEYDPLLADAGAKLVEKVTKAKFAHTTGKPTEMQITIGAKGKIQPRRNYYLTTFILDGKQRTHIGEKDGKSGLCRVISAGHPRDVNIIVRAVR